jgi:hypothetical protein
VPEPVPAEEPTRRLPDEQPRPQPRSPAPGPARTRSAPPAAAEQLTLPDPAEEEPGERG